MKSQGFDDCFWILAIQNVPRPPLFPSLADLTFHSLSGLLSTICLLDLPHLAKPAFQPSPDSNAERRRPACRIA